MRRVIIGALLLCALVFAGAALAAKGGGRNSLGVIVVPDAVYGGTTTATVNPGGESAEVFVQCYAPDFGGTYVYAAYFPVNASNEAVIGPLWSTRWPQGPASCRAQEGYFKRDGFGRWVALATTTFSVSG